MVLTFRRHVAQDFGLGGIIRETFGQTLAQVKNLASVVLPVERTFRWEVVNDT